MSEKEYSEFSELNALGNPNRIISLGENSMNSVGSGPIGNARPGSVVAEGIDIDTFPKLFESPGVRKGMSTTRNESVKRAMGSRR